MRVVYFATQSVHLRTIYIYNDVQIFKNLNVIIKFLIFQNSKLHATHPIFENLLSLQYFNLYNFDIYSFCSSYL